MSGAQTRAAGYTRVSTVQQEDGYGLEAQREEIEAYAGKQGWEIVAWYSDVESGAKSAKDRKGLDDAISAAKRGDYKVLVVREVSRFSRTFLDSLRTVEALHEVGASVVDVGGKKSTDRLVFNILSAVAEEERRLIRERVMGGMRVAARKGKWGGGPTPYGYKLHPTRDKTDPNWNTLVIHEDEAENVRQLFQMATLPDGSILKTSREAAKRGFKNRDGLPFSKTHIGELLRNRIYLGEGHPKTLFKGREDEVSVVTPAPQLVDADLFEQVQDTLERRRLRYLPRTNEKWEYPLRKRIVHVHPDGSIWGMGGEFPQSPRRTERLYRCQSWRHQEVKCPGMSPPGTPVQFIRSSVAAAYAERLVLQFGLDALDDPDQIGALADNVTRTKLAVLGNRDTRKDIRKRMTDLDKKRERTLDQHRNGWVSDSEAKEIMASIAADRAALEADLALLNSTVDTDSLYQRLLQVEVGGMTPDWYKPGWDIPKAGVVTPADPQWGALVRGLQDEVNGEAPDQDWDDLSDWAKSWTSHVVTTLDLYLVVPAHGSYLDAYVTMGDPRD